MPTKKRTSKAESPERTGPPEHILKRLAGQRSLLERFRDPPGEELTRAQALGTWLNFFCDYAIYPEVHRGHYAAVHKAATDYLIRLADAHGIDGTPLHHAGELCRYLAKQQELRDPDAETHLWPACLGKYRYSLPQAQQDVIEAGERVIQQLRLKVGFKAAWARETSPAVGDLVSLPRIAEVFRLTDQEKERLRSRLAYWRKGHFDGGWIENQEATAREPRYVYPFGKIKHLI